MKKLIKRIKCPECGAEFEGFWVNPICTCGHQLRELTTTEAAWSNIDKYDAVQAKRDSVRKSEWGFVDFKWCSIMDLTFILFDAVFIFKNLPYLFPTKSTLNLVILIGVIVMGVSVKYSTDKSGSLSLSRVVLTSLIYNAPTRQSISFVAPVQVS